MTVFLRQWGGEVTGLEADLCFGGTNQAKAKTKRDLTGHPGKPGPPRAAARGAAQRGWSGGRMPIEMRVFLQVL